MLDLLTLSALRLTNNLFVKYTHYFLLSTFVLMQSHLLGGVQWSGLTKSSCNVMQCEPFGNNAHLPHLQTASSPISRPLIFSNTLKKSGRYPDLLQYHTNNDNWSYFCGWMLWLVDQPYLCIMCRQATLLPSTGCWHWTGVVETS